MPLSVHHSWNSSVVKVNLICDYGMNSVQTFLGGLASTSLFVEVELVA